MLIAIECEDNHARLDLCRKADKNHKMKADDTPIKIGTSTGARWAADNPQSAALAVALCAQGSSLQSICESCGGPSTNTVRAYLISTGTYDADELEILKTARRATLRLIRNLEEKADDMPLPALAMSAKLAMDTALAAKGAPTQIVQHNHKIEVSPITRDRVREFRAQLQKGKVIDVEAETAGKK